MTEQMNSEVYMVLNAAKKDGFLKSSNSYLVFLQDKIVVAVVTEKRLNEELIKMQQKNKEEGKGFLKGAAAMINFWSSYGNRFYTMTPEEILQEDKSNFVINNSDVKKVMFKKAKGDHHQDDYKPGQLIIDANNIIKTSHSYTDGNKNIKKVLESLYGNRLQYKSGFGINIELGGSKEGFR